MKKGISIFIYVVGSSLVAFFIAKALLGGNTVLNPDAMLPFTEFERNTIFLGLGFIPMVLSCVFLIKTFDIKAKLKKVLVFVPGIITGIPFVYGVGLIITLMIIGVKDIIVG